MTDADDIANLDELLKRLRTVDRHHRVFGSEKHLYRLGPVLAEAELKAFETTHQVKLPDDYRQFLATVGNGGAGPFYGLEPLGAFSRDLSKAFPFTSATDQLTDEELALLSDRDDYPGILEFCDQGCAIYAYLVVNGPSFGTIWNGREDFFPTHLSFSNWYRSWLERALTTLGNERLISRIRLGMSRSDVLAEIGGDWHEREAPGRPTRYFEASDIPAQLELDERDVVVKISPWSFITARPD